MDDNAADMLMRSAHFIVAQSMNLTPPAATVAPAKTP
jgi:hypothetical protein